MDSVITFLNEFRRREGLKVAMSSLFLKFCSFFTSIFIVRLIPQGQLGEITFAMSIISIVTVFAGFGSNWSLLRYGALEKGYLAKYNILKYSIVNGSKFNLILFLLILLASFFLPLNVENAQIYLVILALGIFSNFLFESLLSYFRILQKNNLFSKANIQYSFLLIIFTFGLAYFFEGIGYVLAIIVSPILIFLFYYRYILKKKKSENKMKININTNEYIKYGIYTGIGVIANQILISSGGMLAGFFGAKSNDIAVFKIATIIPFNLMFIPLMIMTTDFVHFSKNEQNKEVLWLYYVRYIKTVILICLIPFILLLLFNKEMIIILFGNEYQSASRMSFFLIVAVFFSFLFRIPLGNILSAVGKANWNVIHAIIWFIIFIPTTIIFFNFLGVEGIALSIAIVMIVSGFVSLFLFLKYLKTLN